MTTLIVSERFTKKSPGGGVAEHLEQVSQKSTDVLSDETVGLTLPNRKLVAVQQPRHLEMLQTVLEETDPETTEIIVMKAKTSPAWGSPSKPEGLDRYDRQLITAVIELGETIGKPVKPLVVPTNNALFAIMNTARCLGVQEIVVGTSHKMTNEALLERLVDQWSRLPRGPSTPPTIRVLGGKVEIHRRSAPIISNP